MKITFEKINDKWECHVDGVPYIKNEKLSYLLIEMSKQFREKGE